MQNESRLSDAQNVAAGSRLIDYSDVDTCYFSEEGPKAQRMESHYTSH